jgi:tetratricopeptide (TPR) repeat protein
MVLKGRRLLGACALGLSVVASWGGLHGTWPALGADDDHLRRPAVEPSATPTRQPYDDQQVQKTVEFWEQREKKDPRGAVARRNLAGAYLARARETGRIEDSVLAERAALSSLEILPRSNAVALNKLANALLSQHRFPEALEVADRALALDPEAHRLRADILLELGEYQAARKALGQIPDREHDLNLMALRARFAEVEGRIDRSIDLLRAAGRIADTLPDMPAEAVAWYHTMVGHRLIDTGKLDDGEQACKDALAIFPRDYRAMTGLAEAATSRRDWQAAVILGRKAVETSPQNPEAYRILGDAYAALGRTADAEQQYQLLEQLAHSFPRIYDRHWALFCADKGRHLDEALTLARNDLELRRDVHAYDTLAWVCFKKGLQKDAETAMEKALAQGTAEALLLYHAGMIARAGGDQTRANTYFDRARAINPANVMDDTPVGIRD